MFDLAIRSLNTITPEGTKDAVVLIKNGIIAEIASSLSGIEALEIIDVADKVLMPGVIDPHVHINEPGRTEWEGFDTATKAAIAGGVTCLVDMPLNASPVTTSATALIEKLRSTQNKLHASCAFWGGIIPGNENEIPGLIDEGVLGFKAFLTHSGIDEFPNATEADLRKAMPVIAKNNLPLLVHCELTDDIARATGDIRSYQNYLASRPKEWEDKAIALMIRLCEEYNCHVHIVHLSSADSIEQLLKAKQKGLRITVETAQHYLFFNAEEIRNGETQYKCAPPIREAQNNEQLWQALKDGIVDFVATDHSPAPPDLKQIESGDFMKAWGGIASIQFTLPALWTAAKQRYCTLNDLAKWLCENPARLLGKEHQKGKIEIGFDADLIILDPEKSFTVTEDIIHHKHKITPYRNRQLFGVVEQTFIAGKKVYRDGTFIELNKGTLVLNNIKT
ncbi:MAG TPA: allantoinase AllB [Segetibacter sp.]